jgi:hypothetical protein
LGLWVAGYWEIYLAEPLVLGENVSAAEDKDCGEKNIT